MPSDESRKTPQYSRPSRCNQLSVHRHYSNRRKAPLPPAIIPPPRRVDSDQVPPTAVSLPSDSDEAALDAMTAAGKPLPLADAIQHAFRLQPRLRAQLENIAQARGQQQIAFSAFLPLVAANYDTGEYSLGANGNSIGLPKSSQGFNFIPGVGAMPFGLNVGTNFELAELKVQWLLLDFGRRLGRYEQARWRPKSRGCKPTAPTKPLPTRSRSPTTTFSGPRPCGEPHRMPSAAPTKSSLMRENGNARASSSVKSSFGPRSSAPRRFRLITPRPRPSSLLSRRLISLIGLKCNQPIRVVEPPETPPPGFSLADCLETAVRERREFNVVRSTVEVAVQGSRVARADFAPKVIANGTVFDFLQQHNDGRVDFRMGFIRLEWALFEGGRRIAATRVAEAQVRQAMAQAESIADQIAFQVNEAYRAAVTAWVGIADARPAVDQARENYRLVQLRLREGAATPTEIADAQATLDPRRTEPSQRALQLPDRDGSPTLRHGSRQHADDHGRRSSLEGASRIRTNTNEYNAGSPPAPPDHGPATPTASSAEPLPLVVAHGSVPAGSSRSRWSSP